MNPSPLLANVTYQKLALRCEMGRYDEVLELVPLLSETFDKLKMRSEQAKCFFLHAIAFKESGNSKSAFPLFEKVASEFETAAPEIAAHALIELGEMHVSEGSDNKAANSFERAMALIAGYRRPALVAHLQAVVGETYQRQGRLNEAIASYLTAIESFDELAMTTRVAYLRLVLAQALLADERPNEAAWQILSALPTIDEQKMLPEGFAAIKLLAESARQRRLDEQALRAVREQLSSRN